MVRWKPTNLTHPGFFPPPIYFSNMRHVLCGANGRKEKLSPRGTPASASAAAATTTAPYDMPTRAAATGDMDRLAAQFPCDLLIANVRDLVVPRLCCVAPSCNEFHPFGDMCCVHRWRR